MEAGVKMRRRESGPAAEKLTNDVRLRFGPVETELVERWKRRGLEEEKRKGGWEDESEMEGVRLG